jgi:hypothetical protein
MDFSVKDIKMGIENLHNGNTVLRKSFSNAAADCVPVANAIHKATACLRKCEECRGANIKPRTFLTSILDRDLLSDPRSGRSTLRGNIPSFRRDFSFSRRQV